MTPDLQDLLRQIEAIKSEGHAVCAGLSESQFNWRPGEGRWSIAECLVHLNVSITVTLPAFERAIEQGRAKGLMGQGPFRYGWFASWVAGSMEPPPRWRMRTVKILKVPAGATHALARVLPEFIALRDQLADRVRRANSLDLRRVRVVSPVNRLLRMPIGAYFQFVLAHDRRHLWQARQVRNAPGFGL
jgi:hypothetical protein